MGRDRQQQHMLDRLAEVNAQRRAALARGDAAAVDRLEQRAFAVKNFYD